jgi:transcriptional regulator with XRE-family HTH domain
MIKSATEQSLWLIFVFICVLFCYANNSSELCKGYKLILKGYISRVERGLTIPTVATLYKIVAAMGLRVVFIPQNMTETM